MEMKWFAQRGLRDDSHEDLLLAIPHWGAGKPCEARGWVGGDCGVIGVLDLSLRPPGVDVLALATDGIINLVGKISKGNINPKNAQVLVYMFAIFRVRYG
jgi:hypothetical protein